MSKVPSLNYGKIIRALHRDGWVVVGQRGSHIELHKRTGGEILKLVVPAHKPVKRTTLSHIIKQAGMTLEQFLKLLRQPAHNAIGRKS